MKKEKRTVSIFVEKEQYLSKDGYWFNTEEECLEHERSLGYKEKCKQLLDEKKLNYNVVPIEFLASFDDCESWFGWYKVETQEELDALIDAFETFYEQELDGFTLERPTIVCLVSYSDYHDCGDIVTKEAAAATAEKYLEWYKEI